MAKRICLRKLTPEENVEIRRSILWEEVSIKRGIKVIDSIVTSFREVERDMTGKIF